MRKLIDLIFVTVLLLLIVSSCSNDANYPGRGVSKELAEDRYVNISTVYYRLHFSIPEKIDQAVDANLTVTFNLKEQNTIYLDFLSHSPGGVKKLIVNGSECRPILKDEHIKIEKRDLFSGENIIYVEFEADDKSLNRREEFLYTLLVPDRARRLFPCFDQPDIKAIYELSLDIPDGWRAVANAPLEDRAESFIKFAPSDPLPTYLFSFVAGIFNEHTVYRGDREITIFHRESEQFKIEQCDIIGDLIFNSIEWLEDYTQVPYPFAKYDIAIVPGFQYGGMEHAGATVYADRVMFTGEHPTMGERFARAKLIAHETAHMWFGDFVTMKWFDDVWTKEVFANWFAAKMVEAEFPEIDHHLAFIDSYYPAAYQEERTLGTTPVLQRLDNLEDAGLIYGNIIYNKAPIVMEMLVKQMGGELFQTGVREYLRRFAYSNATWDDLIDIFDELVPTNLREWSDVWIKERGMPDIYIYGGDSLTVEQYDPFGRGVKWIQSINNEMSEDGCVYPNIDGFGYGHFITDSVSRERVMERLPVFKPITRESMIIMLFENVYRGVLSPERFSEALRNLLLTEEVKIIFSRASGYLANINRNFSISSESLRQSALLLWSIALSDRDHDLRITAFRSLLEFVQGEEWTELLYDLLSRPERYPSLKLNENDRIRLIYEISLRSPQRYTMLKDIADTIITNSDRMEEFKYVYPALSPSPTVRDSVFKSLLKPENRRVEPWTITALSYLCHYSRDDDAINYLEPALAILPEIKRGSDIFFPVNWLRALMKDRRSPKAAVVVNNYIESAKIDPLLKSKVLQQSDHIIRGTFCVMRKK